MRIRLVIIDSNTKYADRLIANLEMHYPEKFEIYQFSRPETFRAFIAESRADVLLMSEDVDLELPALPVNLAYAFFADSPSVDTIKNVKTVCRFQKLNLIYKEILSLYSERHTNITSYKNQSNSHTRLQLFVPVSGGVGATTAACAMAIYCAAKGQKVLYFSLEQCADTSFWLDGATGATFSDVVYTIAINKSNIKLRLESMTSTSSQNVQYYASPAIGLDSLELSPEDITRLLEELLSLGAYDTIVVDMDNHLNQRLAAAIKMADSVVLVADGSPASNAKFQKYYECLKIVSEKNKLSVENKWKILYNRFSSKTGTRLEWQDIPIAGGIPNIQSLDSKAILAEMARQPVFELI